MRREGRKTTNQVGKLTAHVLLIIISNITELPFGWVSFEISKLKIYLNKVKTIMVDFDGIIVTSMLTFNEQVVRILLRNKIIMIINI